MKEVFSKSFTGDQKVIRAFVHAFESEGRDFDERIRNSLKLFELGEETINIKSFKKPNFINSLAYRFFRLSKAQRSFEYAHKLIEKGIGTPQPIAYYEERSVLGFKRSYYISKHLSYDLTYRELIRDSKYTGDKTLLRAFGKFTYALHAKGVHFLDHSPGNTLIRLDKDIPSFFLVDLNRMKFGQMDFTTRMKNFERLSKYDEHIRFMAEGYAAASGEEEEHVFLTMQSNIKSYQEKFYRKKRIKNKLKRKK